MCRIVGMIDKKSHCIEEDILKMRDAMTHGGPDSEGVYIDHSSSLALGHRRLSIIDMSEKGNQPMLNDSRDLIIVFNGEIYNFPELKAELESYNYHFFSNCDT